MKRLFWLGLGVAAGVALTRKVNATTRKLTPVGAAENAGDAIRELAEAVGSFGADVRAGMAERERELHATVAERTGITTAPRHLAWTPPQEDRAQLGGQVERARRAGE